MSYELHVNIMQSLWLTLGFLYSALHVFEFNPSDNAKFILALIILVLSIFAAVSTAMVIWS